jgi:transcriptional regulator with XRE-family HTH domain
VTEKELSQRLRALRLQAGLSQTQLAAKLGEGRERLSAYEQGRNGVPLELAQRWAEACGHRLVVELQKQGPAGAPRLDDRDEGIVAALVDALRRSGSQDFRLMLLMISEAMRQQPLPEVDPQADALLVNENHGSTYTPQKPSVR